MESLQRAARKLLQFLPTAIYVLFIAGIAAVVAVVIIYFGWKAVTSFTEEDFTYQKRDDYLEVNRYSGDDTQAAIPAEVQGLPVREITFFADEKRLLEQLTLPESLAVLSGNPFTQAPALQAFCISGENECYKTVDGVLFTADGKTLVAYPQGRSGEYAVPEGVEVIGSGAFQGSVLSGVTLPQSLRAIEAQAFSGCPALRVVEIPTGVEAIHETAFQSENENVPAIRLIVTQGTPGHLYTEAMGIPVEELLPGPDFPREEDSPVPGEEAA